MHANYNRFLNLEMRWFVQLTSGRPALTGRQSKILWQIEGWNRGEIMIRTEEYLKTKLEKKTHSYPLSPRQSEDHITMREIVL